MRGNDRWRDCCSWRLAAQGQHYYGTDQRIAAENSHVTAHVYDIRHFEELKNRYKVMSVPCLVINDEKIAFGKKNGTLSSITLRSGCRYLHALNGSLNIVTWRQGVLDNALWRYFLRRITAVSRIFCGKSCESFQVFQLIQKYSEFDCFVLSASLIQQSRAFGTIIWQRSYTVYARRWRQPLPESRQKEPVRIPWLVLCYFL